MTICDNWGRPVTELRISVNSSAYCNFSCIFCHKEGIYDPYLSPMTPEEIERVVRVTTQFGVKRVKLTGGEPMLRDDIPEIVERIHTQGIKEISMTTNGTRLAKLARTLKKRGLSRVNVSLHSLREDTFRLLTQSCKLKETIQAIRVAVEVGLKPVKINMTLLKSINESEVEDMINFSKGLGGARTNILQLIEFVSVDRASCTQLHLKLDEIEENIRRRAFAVRMRDLHRRPQYFLDNGVVVEIVRPVHNSSFCMGNNRLRITYDGKFKPCLLRDDNHVDFLSAMRSGASDADLVNIFKRAVSMREPFFKPQVEIPRNKILLTCAQ